MKLNVTYENRSFTNEKGEIITYKQICIAGVPVRTYPKDRRGRYILLNLIDDINPCASKEKGE